MRYARAVAQWSIAAGFAGVAAVAAAQAWSPQKNVEIVVPNPPGGSNDKTARSLERIILTNKLLPVSLSINNRSGGGGSIAYTYVQQRNADPHYLVVAGPAILTNHIVGSSTLRHSDLTPVASLFDDYTVFAVAANSNLKTGKDLIERLRKDPKSVTIGFSPLLGSHNHIAAGVLMKTIGGAARDLKVVAFKGSSDAVTTLLGGHIDLVTTAAGNVAPHVAAGRMRVLGITSAKRFPGAFAEVPTWKEQGADFTFGAWRSMFAPKGITPQQLAYWEGVLRKATEAPEWKEELEKNIWSNVFTPSAQFSKDLEQDYASMKAVLVDLGLAK
jgi:putative tricarboxylic transport membrane protein